MDQGVQSNLYSLFLCNRAIRRPSTPTNVIIQRKEGS